MVVWRWRLMRIWVLENAAVAHQIRKQAGANESEVIASPRRRRR